MNNRRIIYIHDDNIETYDKIENKSEFINQRIREIKVQKPKEVDNDFTKKIEELRGLSTTN